MATIAGFPAFKLSSYNDLAELKQLLLLFDAIGFMFLPSQISGLRKHSLRYPVLGQMANELEFLQAEGYLVNPFKTGETFIFQSPDHSVHGFAEDFAFIMGMVSDGKGGFIKGKAPVHSKLIEEAKARLCCLKLNYEQQDIIAVPLVPQLKLPSEAKATKTDVLKLLVKNIPVPDNQTPWVKIMEFKSNPDNKGRMALLRDWTNKAASSGKSISEINDELEALLYQYRKSLELHKIKSQTGFFQTLIVGGAELLENAAKLKFSAIAKGLFSAQVTQAELSNAELSNPGNTLAYLYKVNETFKK